MKTHERFLERAKEGNIDLLFLGDSITAGWNGGGKGGLEPHLRPAQRPPTSASAATAPSTSSGGSRTARSTGIKPKVVVLMIGTNNPGSNTADEIADGIKAIVKRLREKLPETKVLLLAVFPRGEKPNPGREKLIAVNEKIARLDDGKMVTYLDIGKKFLNDDGTISKEIMPDFLHLSPKGYQIWADAIEPTLAKMLD